MTFDQKHIPFPGGPSPPGEGSHGQRFKKIDRPSITEEVQKLEEAVENTGGDPVAYCTDCKKRCEDCAVQCREGFEWRDS